MQLFLFRRKSVAMVKTKELSEYPKLEVLTGYSDGKGYKAIAKQFQVLLPTV